MGARRAGFPALVAVVLAVWTAACGGTGAPQAGRASPSPPVPYAATFAPQAIAAARAAHPGQVVLSGLSTNPNGRGVGPADLLTLYRAASAAGAAGSWLNIPEAGRECPRCGAPQPEVAVQFLESLAGGGPAST